MMRAMAPSAPAPMPTPSRARHRLRLLAMGLLIAFWLLPWPEMEIRGDQGPADVMYEALPGTQRTGAIGATSLLVMWCLGATILMAPSIGGLRRGGALADALLAGGATLLLALEHPWIGGGELRQAWGSIFAPLTLLALLDAWTARGTTRPPTGVLGVRALAGFVATAALAIRFAWIPAGLAAWLTISPLLWLRAERAPTGRRVAEALLLIAALMHGFSTLIQEQALGTLLPRGPKLNLPFVVWGIATALVAMTALEGLWRGDATDEDPAGAPA